MSPPYVKLATTILGFMFINMFYDASEARLVHQLPGQPQVSFKQYAGYITVGKKNDRALFYYFVEAVQNPSLKPLVLWLNGGPGCSSLGIGAFFENGPFQPRGNVLIRNDYSWNKEANILYLETPAGVGFSYSNITSFYKGSTTKLPLYSPVSSSHAAIQPKAEYLQSQRNRYWQSVAELRKGLQCQSKVPVVTWTHF